MKSNQRTNIISEYGKYPKSTFIPCILLIINVIVLHLILQTIKETTKDATDLVLKLHNIKYRKLVFIDH